MLLFVGKVSRFSKKTIDNYWEWQYVLHAAVKHGILLATSIDFQSKLSVPTGIGCGDRICMKLLLHEAVAMSPYLLPGIRGKVFKYTIDNYWI